MTRLARVGVCALALVAAGMAAASGPAAAAGEDKEARQKRQLRIVSRSGGSYLGVEIEDVSREDVARLKLDGERGALVREVVDGSAAAKAGLKPQDVILGYQGEAVLSAAQLARLVRETPLGRSVPLEVSRDGAIQKLSVTPSEGGAGPWRKGTPDVDVDVELPGLLEPPEPPEPPQAPGPAPSWMGEMLGRHWGPGFSFGWGGPRRLGIGYQQISGQLARYFKVAGETGVLVTEVDEDGPAGKAGVKAGDVVLAFDAKQIRDGDDLRRAVRDAEAGREAKLKVQRDGRPMELGVTLAGREQERRKGAGI